MASAMPRVLLILMGLGWLFVPIAPAVAEQNVLPGRARSTVAALPSNAPVCQLPPAVASPLGLMSGSRSLAFIENQGQFDARAKYSVRSGSQTLWLTADGIIFDLRRVKQPTAMRREARERLDRERLVVAQDFVGVNKRPRAEASGAQPGIHNYFLGNDPAKWRTGVKAYTEVVYRDVWEGINLKLYGNGRDLEQEFIVRPGADLSQIRVAYRGIEGLRIAGDGGLVIETAFGELKESQPRIYQVVDGQRIAVSGRFKVLSETAYTFEVGPYQSRYALVIDPTLVFSTYLGGSDFDGGAGIAVDGAGNTYVAGTTGSTDFPTTPGAFQTSLRGAELDDVFVTKLNATGSALVYSTYLGGSFFDDATGIAVDAAGNAYVTGGTSSNNFPTTPGAFQRVPGGDDDAFVTKLNPTGSALVYSTYLGGSGFDDPSGIAIDTTGNAYVTGGTDSDFPTTPGAFQPSFGGGFGDGFVTKLNATGSALVYSTFLGGSEFDVGLSIAVEAAGNAYVTGFTGATGNAYVTGFTGRRVEPVGGVASSADFPTTPGAFQPTPRGQSDAFVTKLNATGSGLVYSTFLGGSDDDEGFSIVVDADGNAFVTGETTSSAAPPPIPPVAQSAQPAAPFPTTPGAFQPTFGGGFRDAFVTKLNSTGSALVYSTYLGGSDDDEGFSIVVDAAGNAHVTGQTGGNDDTPRAQAQDDPFPTTPGTFQPTPGGGGDAFLTKLNATGSALLDSTFLGGRDFDAGSGIAVDAAGDAYVTGFTDSTNFPTTGSAFRPVAPGGSNAFVARFDFGAPGAPSVSAILPSTGGDTGSVSAIIHGGGFASGAIVRFVRAGQPDIVGDPVSVDSGGRTIAATFDLTGKARGAWDVVVTNADGTSATLAQGFTIEQGRAPEVWVDILGRGTIRAGREETFTIVVGNRGNTDAVGVPLRIDGIPEDATVRLAATLVPPPPLPGGPPIDFTGAPVLIDTAEQRVVLLLVPVIPPGFTATLGMVLTTTSSQPFELRTVINPPLFPSPSGQRLEVNPEYVLCVDQVATALVGVAPAAGCAVSLAPPHIDALYDTTVAGVSRRTSAVPFAWTVFNFLVGCFPGETGQRLVAERIARITDIGRIVEGALPDSPCARTINSLGGREAKLAVQVVASRDPNDKVGSRGAGVARYVSGDEALRYEIDFENLETATAPAQEVVITDQLDVANGDLRTFSLGSIAFGDRVVVPPPGLSEFTTDVDLRPGQDLIVRITARLDAATGLVTWRYTSLDPATGQPPADPLEGFLPPNVTPPEGQGRVFFTLRPKAGLPTDTAIRNTARIVFDANPPIATQEWVNTLDNAKPGSQVLALPPTQHTGRFEIRWSSADVRSGVLDHTIFSSEDGGPFAPFLRNTTATSALFTGRSGHSYAFYSVARDRTGNVEDAPTVPDATTRVVVDTGAPVTTATGSPAANANGWNNTDVTVTLNAVDNVGGAGVEDITVSLRGAETRDTVVVGGRGTVTLSREGTTTVTYFARDDVGNQEAPKVLTVRIDKTPPTVTAALIAVGEVGAVGAVGALGETEDREGRFRVQFACTDSLSGGVTASARLNAFTVANGQVVALEVDDETDAEFDRQGRLTELEAPSFSLVVTCTDAAGNQGTARATPRFPTDGDDDDDDDGDDD
jgi:hypothetical protein